MARESNKKQLAFRNLNQWLINLFAIDPLISLKHGGLMAD